MEDLLQRHWAMSPRLQHGKTSSAKMDLNSLAETERIHN